MLNLMLPQPVIIRTSHSYGSFPRRHNRPHWLLFDSTLWIFRRCLKRLVLTWRSMTGFKIFSCLVPDIVKIVVNKPARLANWWKRKIRSIIVVSVVVWIVIIYWRHSCVWILVIHVVVWVKVRLMKWFRLITIHELLSVWPSRFIWRSHLRANILRRWIDLYSNFCDPRCEHLRRFCMGMMSFFFKFLFFYIRNVLLSCHTSVVPRLVPGYIRNFLHL